MHIDPNAAEKRLIQRQQTNKIGLAIAATVLMLFVLGFTIIFHDKHLVKPVADALIAISTGFVVSSIGYLISCRSKYENDREQSLNLQADIKPLDLGIKAIMEAVKNNSHLKMYQVGTTPWSERIANATQIDFVVQGWDGWIGEVAVASDFECFLAQGHTINLFVYHYDNYYSESLHKAQSERLRHGNALLQIFETIKNFQDVVNKVSRSLATSAPKPKLNIRLIKRVNWYCAIRFRPNWILLSPYAHSPLLVQHAPAILFQTDFYPQINKWFEDELEFMNKDDNSELLDPTTFDIAYSAWKGSK